MRARWRGVPIALTETELRLVGRLVDRLGEVVEQRDLLAYAWPGVADPDPLWLKPHLARLRVKLVAAGAPVPVPVRGVVHVARTREIGDVTAADATDPEPSLADDAAVTAACPRPRHPAHRRASTARSRLASRARRASVPGAAA